MDAVGLMISVLRTKQTAHRAFRSFPRGCFIAGKGTWGILKVGSCLIASQEIQCLLQYRCFVFVFLLSAYVGVLEKKRKVLRIWGKMNAMLWWRVLHHWKANSHEKSAWQKYFIGDVFQPNCLRILFPPHSLNCMVEKLTCWTYALQSAGNLGTERQVLFFFFPLNLSLPFCSNLIFFTFFFCEGRMHSGRIFFLYTLLALAVLYSHAA